MSKNISLEQFIEKAKKREQDRLKLSTIELKGFGVIPLVSLGFDRIMGMLDGLENATAKQRMNADKELVYKSISMLSDKSLLESFDDLVEPFDVVYKVFSLEEVNTIIEHIMRFNGLNVSEEELKKS